MTDVKTTDVEAVVAAIFPTQPVDEVLAPNRRDVIGNDATLLIEPDKFKRKLRVVPGSRVFVGGGGIVLQCEEVDVPGVYFALKVARPSLFQGEGASNANQEIAKADLEYRRHLPLAHPNIAKLFSPHALEVSTGGINFMRLPCWLIEWVDGAKPFNDYCREQHVTPRDLCLLLEQVAMALDHVHRSGVIHWDVKSENLLVSTSGQVKLMDLGNSRPHFPGTYLTDSTAESTFRNLPPALGRRVPKAGAGIDPTISQNRVPVPLYSAEPSWDIPALDLYMLGRELQRLLKGELEGESAVVGGLLSADFADEDERHASTYVEEVVDRLAQSLGETGEPFYSDAGSFGVALRRLRQGLGDADGIPELSSDPQHVLRLPPATNVPWTPRLDALFNSEPMSRLKSHRQLATVHHVYPGAEHSRWEHSAGAVEKVARYVRALMADRTSIQFRLDASRSDIEALILAAAVHDLGHPAFGHQLEETLVVADEFAHEAHSLAVLRTCLGEEPSSELVGADARALWEIVDRWWTESTSTEALIQRALEILTPPAASGRVAPAQDRKEELRLILHSILSGPLDADKADYLARDAHHCGVSYGAAVESLRLLQALTTYSTSDGPRLQAGLAVSEKGVEAVDTVLFARHSMFAAVYWQRTVRAMTAMLEEAVETRLLGDELEPQQRSHERLAELVEAFRVLSDEDALDWMCNDDALAKRMVPLISGVRGKREHIYWCVAELYGGEEFRSKDVEVFNDKLYRILADEQEKLIRIARKDPAAAVSRRRARRARLASRLAEMVGFSPDDISWRDVLLDFPVASKDQVRDLYVVQGRGRDQEVVSVHQLSPIAAAVKEAFERSVRRARVFLEPSLAARISAEFSDSVLAARVTACLEDVIEGQAHVPLRW